MAYFADLDSDNRVLQVLIVNDDNITPGDDAANEAWCEANLSHLTNGVSWKQTFRDGTRGLYANGENMIYRATDWEGHATIVTGKPRWLDEIDLLHTKLR